MEQNPNLIRRAERRAMLEAIVVHRYGIDVMDLITFRPLSSGRFFDLSIRDLLRLLSFSDLLKCLTHHVAKIDQFLLAELTSDKLVTFDSNRDGSDRFILNHTRVDLGPDNTSIVPWWIWNGSHWVPETFITEPEAQQ